MEVKAGEEGEEKYKSVRAHTHTHMHTPPA